jgi:hypothetical protein
MARKNFPLHFLIPALLVLLPVLFQNAFSVQAAPRFALTTTPSLTATNTITETLTPLPTFTPTNTSTAISTLAATTTSMPTQTEISTLTSTAKPPSTPWVIPVVLTSTPPFTQGSTCAYVLRIFVYVDSNDDKLMSPREGAEWLEIIIMDQSYARLDSRYTQEGQAVFCLGGGQLGRTLRVEIPYLHQAQTVNISKNLSEDVEVWFRLNQPTLPLYLP